MMLHFDCENFSRIVDDLSRDALADEEALASLEHAKACPACAGRLEQARLLTSALRGVEADCEPREAPPEVEQALRTRFRQQTNLVRWRRRRQRWVAVAVAAGILLVAGLSARFAWLSHAHHNSAPAMQRPAERSPSPAAVTSPSPAVEAESVQPEDLSSFLPLPSAEGAPPVTEEQVIRVSVPAAALSDIGLPVSAQQSSQYVTADIVLGDDGIARAIRIVQ
ncbi:MAG: hypothetical protein ACRD1N_11175 [Terriglobia bacterium]